MADTNILTAEAEQQLRQPIDDAIGKIQDQINVLRQEQRWSGFPEPLAGGGRKRWLKKRRESILQS